MILTYNLQKKDEESCKNLISKNLENLMIANIVFFTFAKNRFNRNLPGNVTHYVKSVSAPQGNGRT